MIKQIRPFHVYKNSYGLRVWRDYVLIKDKRPWYGHFFYVNGQQTHYLNDKEGHFMLRQIPIRTRIKPRTILC